MADNVKKIIQETIAEAIKNKSFRIEILHAQVEYAGTLARIGDSIGRILLKFKKSDLDGRSVMARRILGDHVAEIIDLFVKPDERIKQPGIRSMIVPEIEKE